jgi:N-acetylneuraminate lyase
VPNRLLAANNRILPALITPLTAAGELDVASAERLIDHLYNKGVGGLYVTGSTGEGIHLDFSIRKQLVELAVSMSRGRGQVVVHVGAIQASMAFDLAVHAAQAGADAVSSIPPFAGGYSWDEISAFYRRLCEVSPAPVVAYYIPALTGQTFSVDKLASLLSLPNLIGYKSTDTNLYVMQRLLSRFRDNQIMYNGPDELLALGLALGAHGGIGTTYNFMPELILQVAQYCAAGRLTEAVAVQKKVNEVIEVLLGYQGVAATKQILCWQGVIASPTCAAPRASLTAAEQAEFRKKLEHTAIAGSLVK